MSNADLRSTFREARIDHTPKVPLWGIAVAYLLACALFAIVAIAMMTLRGGDLDTDREGLIEVGSQALYLGAMAAGLGLPIFAFGRGLMHHFDWHGIWPFGLIWLANAALVFVLVLNLGPVFNLINLEKFGATGAVAAVFAGLFNGVMDRSFLR